ncbi:MAG: ATP-binding protein [Parcubacteria group bacterium]|nr:ATP-binding protein [Parcubacteria group bacterium]
MSRDGFFCSLLVYGPAGAGKSRLLRSALFDAEGKPRRAKIITFGREFRTISGLPTDVVQRFSSPTLDDRKWLEEFDSFIKFLYVQARKGNHLDVLGFDGFSEFDLLHEETNSSTGFAKFNDLMTDMFGIVQALDPYELGCHVLATARIMDKKMATVGKAGKGIAGDPDYMQELYPSFRGAFRYQLANYFDFVFYLQQERSVQIGKDIETRHILHTLQTGDYMTKMCDPFEERWVEKGYPAELTNVGFNDILGMLESLR